MEIGFTPWMTEFEVDVNDKNINLERIQSRKKERENRKKDRKEKRKNRKDKKKKKTNQRWRNQTQQAALNGPARVRESDSVCCA